MLTKIKSIAVGAALAFAASVAPANAVSVFLTGDSGIFTTRGDNEVLFQNIFDGMNVVNFTDKRLTGLGTTATETYLGSTEFYLDNSSPVTSDNLAGNDIAIFGIRRVDIAATELTALANFTSNGGSLFLVGEGNDFFVNTNQVVNEVLAAVGSSMSLSLTSNFDEGGHIGDPFEVITSGPFGEGVNSWSTQFASTINVGNGTSVVAGTSPIGVFGTGFAHETVGTTVPPSPVPVPTGLPLLASGAFALLALRRRTKSK